jgi:hypothetical protein
MPLLRKRRWLSYSIRTLLIAVTILCVWLGWQWRIVNERRELRSLIESRGGSLTNSSIESAGANPFVAANGPPPPKDPPYFRRWLGDQSVRSITYPQGSLTAGELDSVGHSFPEAIIRPWM